MNRFLNHSKFEQLLNKLPVKRLGALVSFNEDNDQVECYLGTQGYSLYPISYFLDLKDDPAYNLLKDLITDTLGATLDEVLSINKEPCYTDYMHVWKEYVGFTEVYYTCSKCGSKKDKKED